MKQFNKSEAMAFYESEKWQDMDFHEKAGFQLFQDRLCMPFDVFHEAVEKTLDRPVWTHEFGLNRQGLIEEYLGKRDKSTMEEIISLIPPKKLLIIAK